MSDRQTLYLIDGHAQIFRAYFAIRNGMNSPVTGEPTHAVFAFAGMLIKLFEQFHPTYVVMTIDTPGKTFRDEMFPEYKATREAAPEDLAPQIQRIFEMTKLFGIPILGQTGAEADDVIATLVRQTLADPACNDMTIRVVSKDKDLEQLLSDRVTMFDIHTDTVVDAAWLLREKGLTPSQVVDALTLMGDKVDNVPGIEGIGPKTASALLQEFGTIEGIYANIEKIKGKKRENLERGREKLDLSRRLVTLKSDLDLGFDLSKAKIGPIDANGLRHFFSQMGFRRYSADIDKLIGQSPTPQAAAIEMKTTASKPTKTKEKDDAQGELFATSLFETGPLEDGGEATAEPTPEGMTTAADFKYTGIYTRDELDSLVAELKQQKMISVDTETIGLGHTAELCGMSFAWKIGEGVYIPMRSPEQEKHLDTQTVLNGVRAILQDPSLPKCGHNLKYDALVLRHAGVDVQGIAFDSMIATHMIGTPAHGLDYLAEHLLKHKMIPISRLIGERKGKAPQKTMDCVPLAEIVPYAAEDADMALRLYEDLAPKLRDIGMESLSRDLEMPLVEVLVEMEYHGIRVDPVELDRQAAGLNIRIVEARDRILEATGHPFNIDSPKQLADVLFKEFGLPTIKKTQTGQSTDIEVLEKLAEREDLTPQQSTVLTRVIEYRQLSKLVNTYLVNLKDEIDPRDQRVHASFHQTGTATGRLSSSGPNLQNIPIRTEVGRQIRKAFVAAENCHLISADYSQIELRILAHLSDDPNLIDAFKKDMDIHAAVASQVFGVDPKEVSIAQRTYAKTINFGIIYGVTPYGLSRRIDGMDVEGARKLIADYKKRFTGIDSFLSKCVEEAMSTGYVTTMLGRRRRIPQIESSRGQVRALGERLAINTVVQGSAAELIKLAMVNLHRRIRREKLPLKMLLQIHDELVLEAPIAESMAMSRIVQQEMESAMSLKVPLKAEAGVGSDWFGAK